MPGQVFDRAEQQSEREWSYSSDASDKYGSHGLERYLDDKQSKRYKGLDKSLCLQGLSGLNEHYNIIEDSSPIDTNVEDETGGLFEEANPGLTSIGDDNREEESIRYEDEHQFYIRDMHNMSEDDDDKDDEVEHRDSYSYEDQSYVTEKEDSCDSESNQDSYQHETNDSCEDQSYETVTEDSCDSESDQGSYQHETKDSCNIESQLFEVDILDDNNKDESESDQGSNQHETKDSCDIESQLFEVDILDDNNKDDRICETMLKDNMDRCKNDIVMDDYMGEDEDRFETKFESQLCIPLDRLEDIEMFPNFTDDFMSLGDFLLGPDSHDNDFNNLSKLHNDGIVDLSASEISNGISRDLPVLQYPWHSGSMMKDDYFSRYIKQTTDENKEQETRISHDILGGEITKKQRTPCKRKRRKNVHNYQVSYPGSNLPKKQQCSHCKTENTPQWRAGPLGPKTLCNACGVRYRLKKLVPEYRPLASPTFDSKKHSNYHRKIEQRMHNQNRNNMELYERF